MKYSLPLSELYVLRKGHLVKEPSFKEKLVGINYDFKNETLSDDIKLLKDKDRVKFIENIEKYVDNLELEKDKKLFILLIVVFSSLSCVINIKKEPIYSRVRKLAKRLIKEYSEPWFIVEIIERHWEIKVSDLLEN